MLKRLLIIFIISTISLIGCDAEVLISPTPIIKVASPSPFSRIGTPVKLTLTPSYSPTPLPTSTDNPTVTSTLTPNPTSTSSPVVTLYEITIEEPLPSSIQLEGVLILAGRTIDERNCLFNLQDMQCITLPGSYIPTYSIHTVSPDQTRLAILETFTKLLIITADGQQESIDWVDEKKWEIVEWIDNHHLILKEFGRKDGLLNNLNLYTGEWQELVPSFPDVSENGNLWSIELDALGPFVYYDIERTRSIMLRHQNSQSSFVYELVDAETGELLWEKQNDLISNSRPAWSDNGNHFAIIAGPSINYGMLYITDINGQETKIASDVIGELSWSPDESKIATWWRGSLQIENEDVTLSNPLAVVDLATKEISVYVFNQYDDIAFSDIYQYPVWSPDSRYIAITNTDAAEETTSSVIILDTEKRDAFEVAKNFWVRGWLSEEP